MIIAIFRRIQQSSLTIKSTKTNIGFLTFNHDAMKQLAITIIAIALFVPFAQAETLDDALHIALEASNRLMAESHLVEAARANVDAARATRNPVLANRTAYIALSDQPAYSIDLPTIPQLPLPSSINLPISDQSFAVTSTSVTLPLYTGGKIGAMVDASRHQLGATSAGYSASFQDVKIEVAESYFNVLRCRQLLKIAQATENTLLRHQRDVEKLLEQKIVTRNALLAAQAAYSAASQEKLKAENMVLITESVYNRLLGRPLDSPVEIEEIPIPPVSGELETLTAEAMRNRKELTKIASESQASLSLSRASRADRLPQIVATGGHSYLQNSQMAKESYWNGAVGLSWTPIDGGTNRAKSRSSIQAAAASSRMWNEICSQITLQVRTAWILENETRSRIRVATLGHEQAIENYRVVTRQFQEGLVNHTEVLDAQTQLTTAAVNRCNAVYDAIVATCRVRRAVGTM